MTDTILVPEQEMNLDSTVVQDTNYLLKDNYLSEFSSKEEKTAVRHNLGVLPADDTYTKEAVEAVILNKIQEKIQEYSNSLEYLTEDDIRGILSNYIKNDGSTTFLSVQKGVTPISNNDLTTKDYVDRLISNCLQSSDYNKVLDDVEKQLKNYTKKDEVYTTKETYSRQQVDNKINLLVKADGTTPFSKPQSGVDPKTEAHLTTKKYVDGIISTHKSEIDPHGLRSLLENTLRSYALKSDVLRKDQTYTKGQLDNIIDNIAKVYVRNAILDHIDEKDPHNVLGQIQELGYITNDGKTPFLKPQKGVPARYNDELATLGQVKNHSAVWRTSGPVQTTVGFVEDNSVLNDEVSVQEILDAIFYGRGINIETPEVALLGEQVDIKLTTKGEMASVEYAQVLQNGVVIYTLQPKDFSDSETLVLKSKSLVEDTIFTFKVFYINGTHHAVESTTRIEYPIFIGIVPKWRSGNTITYSYLQSLVTGDKLNNNFYCYSNKIAHSYNFTDPSLKEILVAMPIKYPELQQMITPSQHVGPEAFSIIDVIPFQIPGAPKDVLYKLYIYDQALVRLNSPVTFTFES